MNLEAIEAALREELHRLTDEQLVALARSGLSD